MIGKESRKERGNYCSHQDGGDDERQLLRIQAGSCLQIGQSSCDDADVHAVEQTAQAGDEQQETPIADRLCVQH